MHSFNPFSLPFVFLSMLIFLNLTRTHVAAQTFLYHFCANASFPQNSIYSYNINSLLYSFSSIATAAGNVEFYNTTADQTISSNPVYGLFLCRGDVAAEVCQKCVVNATQELAAKCSREKVAVIWYDECMVRYSNEFYLLHRGRKA
jgi:hypothetical protein